MPKNGFTLVELLVAISIVAIIAAATVPNFSAFITSQNLKQAQEQVKNGIRDTQNRAMAGVDSQFDPAFDCGAGCTRYWMIKFTSGGTTYIVGKMATLNDTPTAAECLNNPTARNVAEVSKPLQGGAYISRPAPEACIFYKMISGTPKLVGLGSAVRGDIGVTLGSVQKCIVVNWQGLVKADDECDAN